MAQGRPENTPFSFQGVPGVSDLLRNTTHICMLKRVALRSTLAPFEHILHVCAHIVVKGRWLNWCVEKRLWFGENGA